MMVIIFTPYDKNFNTIPVKNERVDIIKTTTGYVYRRNSATLSPYTDGGRYILKNI